MEEKRTLGEVISTNKGRIIKGSVIVVGIVAGIVIIKLLTNQGNTMVDAIESLSADRVILDGIKNVGDVAEEVVEVIV